MKLNHLRDVVAVAERGSLRSAARQLGLAQPAITRSIRELERELGVQLFERRVTGVILTRMGEVVVRRARVILIELRRTKDEVDQLRGADTGSISFGLSQASHLALLPSVLGPFLRRYANVRLKIVESLFPAIEGDLHDGSIDFYVGPLSEGSLPSEFACEKLLENERVIVGRRGHPLGKATSLADLSGARWVTTSVTIDAHAEIDPLFESFGLPHPTIGIQAQTGMSAIIAVAYSDFLAIVPKQWLSFVKRFDLLQHIAIRERLLAPPIYIVRRPRLPPTPAAEFMCDLIRRAAGHIAEMPSTSKGPAKLAPRRSAIQDKPRR